MFNKTLAIFLTTLALLTNLAIFKSGDLVTTTGPVPTEDSIDNPPPPPAGGERGGQMEPDTLGSGDSY